MRTQPMVENRVLALHAMVTRARLEHDGEAAVRWPAFVRWMNTWQVTPSPGEEDQLAQPPGSWMAETVLQASWRNESLAVLLWTLALQSLSAWDTPAVAPPPQITRRILGGDGGFAGFGRIRPDAEIGALLERAELWHWRSRTTELVANGARPPRPVAEILADAAAVAPPEVPTRDGDLVAFGKPYRDLAHDEWQLARSIAIERHLALSWVTTDDVDWDQVRTDT